jgi:aldose sugar dehydrogenase
MLKTTASLVLVSMAGVACAQNIPAEVKTKDYTIAVQTVASTGLDGPWGIAFIDKDHAIITEKRGTLRLMVDGKLLPDPVKNTPPVLSMGQGGLMDVAVDPDYAKGQANAWVYLAYTDALNDNGRGPAMTRIVRGKIRDGTWTDNQVLWEAKAEHYTGAGVHFGCRIVFDREGKLYFAIGDRGAQDQAQDVTRPNGKTHRINRDGSIPSDNPFANQAGAVKSIYSFGNRNIQGMSFDPRTGLLWAAEHGPRGGDELNLIEAGKNYGWPVITYGINYNGTPITDKTEAPGMEQPKVYWVPSIAVCGIDFYTGGEFEKWNNQVFVAALAAREVRRVQIDASNQVVEQEIILDNIGRVRDVQTSPDGYLYLVMNDPDVVVRLKRR